MRKLICTVLALTLVVVGGFMFTDWLMVLEPGPKRAWFIGASLMIAGLIWLASDWFGL